MTEIFALNREVKDNRNRNLAPVGGVKRYTGRFRAPDTDAETRLLRLRLALRALKAACVFARSNAENT